MLTVLRFSFQYISSAFQNLQGECVSRTATYGTRFTPLLAAVMVGESSAHSLPCCCLTAWGAGTGQGSPQSWTYPCPSPACAVQRSATAKKMFSDSDVQVCYAPANMHTDPFLFSCIKCLTIWARVQRRLNLNLFLVQEDQRSTWTEAITYCSKSWVAS